jgi:hypothetical protein
VARVSYSNASRVTCEPATGRASGIGSSGSTTCPLTEPLRSRRIVAVACSFATTATLSLAPDLPSALE